MKKIFYLFSGSLLILSASDLRASFVQRGENQTLRTLEGQGGSEDPIASSSTDNMETISTDLAEKSSAYWKKDQEEIEAEKMKNPGFPLAMKTGRYITEEEMKRKEDMRAQKMLMMPLKQELEQKVFKVRQQLIESYENVVPEEVLPLLPDSRLAAVLSPLAIREIYLNKDDTPVQRMKKCIQLGLKTRSQEGCGISASLLTELSTLCFADALKAGRIAEPFVPSYGQTDYYLTLAQLALWVSRNPGLEKEHLKQAETYVLKAHAHLDQMLDFPEEVLETIDDENADILIENKKEEMNQNEIKIRGIFLKVNLMKALRELIPLRSEG